MAEQHKEFLVSFKKFYLLWIPSTLVSLGLFYVGYLYYDQNRRIEETARAAGGQVPMGLPPAWTFYVLPWVVGLVILVSFIYVYFQQRGRRVVVTPTHLEMHRGGNVTRTLWQNLSFTPPAADKKSFRTALVSDGSYYERLDEFFYPEFDLFVEFVTRAKKFARENIST